MKKLCVNLAVILTAAVCTQAYAGDAKIYAGADCQRHSGSNTYDHSSGIFRNNSSTQSLTVVCPIVNDSMNRSPKLGWTKVVDFHPTQNFTCSLKTKHRSAAGGWSNYWSGNKTSAGFGTQTQTLSYGGMGHVNHHSHYYITCVIPPRHSNGASYILSSKVEEKD